MAEGDKQKPRGSLMPVLSVFGFGIMVMVLLVAFAGPAGLNLIIAVGGVLAFAGLHYILWGWWLSDWIRRQEQNPDDEAGGDDRRR